MQIVALDAPVEPEPPPPPPRLVKLTRRQWFGEGAARAAEIDFALDPDEIVASYTTTSPEEYVAPRPLPESPSVPPEENGTTKPKRGK